MEEFNDLASEFIFTSSRSSGPGGQLVNKLETKVELRFDIVHSKLIASEIKKRIIHKLGKKISEEGYIIVSSQQHRSQIKNKKECIDKLYAMLLAASQIPKHRKKTKPSAESIEKRIEAKKKTATLKPFRGNLKNKI